MSAPNTELLIESNTAQLDPTPVEPAEPEPSNARSLEDIWPKHECGKSEWAVGVSACACGTAMGMLLVFALCNSSDRNK